MSNLVFSSYLFLWQTRPFDFTEFIYIIDYFNPDKTITSSTDYGSSVFSLHGETCNPSGSQTGENDCLIP